MAVKATDLSGVLTVGSFDHSQLKNMIFSTILWLQLRDSCSGHRGYETDKHQDNCRAAEFMAKASKLSHAGNQEWHKTLSDPLRLLVNCYCGTILNGASLSNFVVNSGLSPAPSGLP
ncbi:MAG: hypothetical protein QNK24_14720 [Desulfuromusa sp.]|nr:hypothetical protein [Desulfuromusa sp.]